MLNTAALQRITKRHAQSSVSKVRWRMDKTKTSKFQAQDQD